MSGGTVRRRFSGWSRPFPPFPMSFHRPSIVFCVWCSQPIVQAAVAGILWRRNLHKQFPVFFWFLLAQIGIFAAIFPLWIAENDTMYFWLFWLGEAVNAILGF